MLGPSRANGQDLWVLVSLNGAIRFLFIFCFKYISWEGVILKVLHYMPCHSWGVFFKKNWARTVLFFSFVPCPVSRGRFVCQAGFSLLEAVRLETPFTFGRGV